MQRNGLLPATPNCDLVLLDRSLDPVAPFVHDWTYEALVYDLLSVEDKAIRWGGGWEGGRTGACVGGWAGWCCVLVGGMSCVRGRVIGWAGAVFVGTVESGGAHGVCRGQRHPSGGGWDTPCCGDGVEAHISCHAGLTSPGAASSHTLP